MGDQMTCVRPLILLLFTAGVAAGVDPGNPANDLGPGFYAPAVTSGFVGVGNQTILAADYCRAELNSPCLARDIHLYVRIPDAPAGPKPVVLVSHGGAGGPANAVGVLYEWSQWLARAGYVAVSVSHPQRDNAEAMALCNALNVPNGADGCTDYGPINWDRPQDLKRVMLELEDLVVSGPSWTEHLDLEQMAVLGHSGGAIGAMSAAGIDRVLQFDAGGAPVVPEVSLPGVDALVALSPASPGRNGLFDTNASNDDHSFQDLAIPSLFLTADGDNTCSSRRSYCYGGFTPSLRRQVIERVPTGLVAHLLYLHTVLANHTLMGGNLQSCHDDAIDQAGIDACNTTMDYLLSSTLAFLDWQLRNHPPAFLWQETEAIEALSGDVAEWVRNAPQLIFTDGFEAGF